MVAMDSVFVTLNLRFCTTLSVTLRFFTVECNFYESPSCLALLNLSVNCVCYAYNFFVMPFVIHLIVNLCSWKVVTVSLKRSKF